MECKYILYRYTGCVVPVCTTINTVLTDCTCVLRVFFPFILDVTFVGRTSRGHAGGRPHRILHPPSFCGACLNFSREKDSAIPFPRRPRSRDSIVLHSLGIFFISFFSEKNPVNRDRTHVPTCQKVTRLPLSYRVDRCICMQCKT